MKPVPQPRWLRLRDIGVTPLFVLTVLLLTFGGLMGVFALIISIAHLSDGVREGGNADTILGLQAIFIFLIVVSCWYRHWRAILLQTVAERFGMKLRAEAMQSAIRNAVRTDMATGVTVLQDISVMQRFVAGGAVPGLLDLSAAMVALGLMFYLDTGLGWIVTAGAAVIVLLAWVMKRAMGGVTGRANAQLNDASADVSGQLVHPDLVRGLGQLPATMFRWQRRYGAALDTVGKAQGRSDAIGEIEALVSNICLMAVIVYAIVLVIESNGTRGLVLAAFFLGNHVLAPFSGLVQHWESWNGGLRAWRQLRTVMRDDAAAPEKPLVPDAPAGLLIDAVTFWPEGRDQPIIGDITLALPPGAVVTVQGRNGVGKSTLLRLVLGLLPPTSGRVLLNGQDTHFCDRARLGARIGYLPQDVQLLEADVFTNIGRGPDAPAELVVAAARAAGAHDLIGRMPMGYQTQAGTSSGLSAGQRRLVALARALYGNPDLLVLDEPEVGLDGPARNAMRAAVERTRLPGGVVLVVTHEPDTWADVADHRLKLGAGGSWELDAAQRGESREPHLATIG